MKIIFKILAIPFIIAFTLLGALMKFFAWLSVRFFAFISLLFGVGGAVLLFNGDIGAGIGTLIIAFLVSPFGIPAIAEVIAGAIDSLNGSLKGFMAS